MNLFKKTCIDNKIKNKPLFFLFTCIKDGRLFIDKLFDSLIHQTKINFIHYIYEDGSSEPLKELIDEYKFKVSQLDTPYEVIYEYNPVNIGLTKSTQHCISKCKCSYFIWIDCDNYVEYTFFEELEKLYKRNKKSLLLRTTLYDSKYMKLYYCNCGLIDEAKTKYQLGLFIRRRYYYSFFAVNYEKYKMLNPSNIFLNEKGFYNDEQVLTLCLLESGYAPLSRTAKGYFLTHDNQESSQVNLPLDTFKDCQINLCYSIGKNLGDKMSAVYETKELYDELFEKYKKDVIRSKEIIKRIKLLSRKYSISLKNYYNYSLIKITLKMNYWRIKNRWKN